MNVVQSTFKRTATVAAAIGLLSASLLPTLGTQTAFAEPSGGQVTSRSITMSSSIASATSVTYNVQFDVASAYAGDSLKGIIVDFCNATGGSPIVTDSNCAAPDAPFSTAAVDVTEGTGLTATEWTAAAILSNRAVRLTNATGETLAANDTVSFELTGIVNPGGVETFYARVITYDSDAGDILSYAAGTEGNTNAIDYGGFALSTASELTVTAKVQESLTFCVYITGANCSGGTGTDVKLGDSNGVLSSYTTTYTSSANNPTPTNPKLGIASNAQGGVAVKMKGGNLCRTSSNCLDTDDPNIIEPQTGSCVADNNASGVEQFGVSVLTAGSGVTADVAYDCNPNEHAFNTASTTSLYGDDLLATGAPSDEVTSELEFAAKAATTTEAGIYRTNISFIATGTY